MLYSNTTGVNNTAVGYEVLKYNTTGNYNVAIGFRAAKLAVNAGIANDSIFIGRGVTPAASGESNQIVIGANSTGNGSNTITLGDTTITGLYCNQTSITALSDARDKTNIYPIPFGLEYINELNPVKFDWKRRDGSYEGVSDIGFIAQDLDKVQDKFGSEKYTRLIDKTNPDQLQASYMRTYPIMVKAIQELSEMVVLLQKEILELKNKL